MIQALEIVKAGVEDAGAASSIMNDAARWLTARGDTLWFPEELSPQRLMPSISAGELFLVMRNGAAVGTVIFQLHDRLYWPDMPEGDSAYIHKITMDGSVRGCGFARQVIVWARQMAQRAGMKYLRLDTEVSRDRLCAFYESAGFVRHSERQVGRHLVARYEMRV
jgi:ribosomal protein S18 acetylase RimI-like enzyme